MSYMFKNNKSEKIKIRRKESGGYKWVTVKPNDFIELELGHGQRLGLEKMFEVEEQPREQEMQLEPEIEISIETHGPAEVREQIAKEKEIEAKKAEKQASKVEEIKKDLIEAKEKVSERLNKLKETVKELQKAEDNMDEKVKHNRRKEDKVKESAEKEKYMNRLLNIKGIGPKTAEDIVTTYETFDDLIKAIKDGKLQFRDDVSALLIDMFG